MVRSFGISLVIDVNFAAGRVLPDANDLMHTNGTCDVFGGNLIMYSVAFSKSCPSTAYIPIQSLNSGRNETSDARNS